MRGPVRPCTVPVWPPEFSSTPSALSILSHASTPMPEAYIVDAIRTPVGRKKGSLAAIHPADLGAHSIQALLRRTGVDPGAVDDVVLGCVDAIGSQAGDIARTCWLVAGLPDHVPGVTRSEE